MVAGLGRDVNIEKSRDMLYEAIKLTSGNGFSTDLPNGTMQYNAISRDLAYLEGLTAFRDGDIDSLEVASGEMVEVEDKSDGLLSDSLQFQQPEDARLRYYELAQVTSFLGRLSTTRALLSRDFEAAEFAETLFTKANGLFDLANSYQAQLVNAANFSILHRIMGASFMESISAPLRLLDGSDKNATLDPLFPSTTKHERVRKIVALRSKSMAAYSLYDAPVFIT